MADVSLDDLIQQDKEKNKTNRINKVVPPTPRNSPTRSSTTIIAFSPDQTITPINDNRKTIAPSRKSSSKRNMKKGTTPETTATKKSKNKTNRKSTRTKMTTGRNKFALSKCSDSVQKSPTKIYT